MKARKESIVTLLFVLLLLGSIMLSFATIGEGRTAHADISGDYKKCPNRTCRTPVGDDFHIICNGGTHQWYCEKCSEYFDDPETCCDDYGKNGICDICGGEVFNEEEEEEKEPEIEKKEEKEEPEEPKEPEEEKEPEEPKEPEEEKEPEEPKEPEEEKEPEIEEKEKKYKVEYNTNGATAGEAPIDNNEYEDGATNFNLESTSGITKTNCKILGWALTDSATEALESYTINKDDAVSGVITFYAVWKELNYHKTVNITVTGLEELAEFGDIAVTADDSELTIAEYSLMVYVDKVGGGDFEVTTSVDAPGMYVVFGVIQCNDADIWFETDDSASAGTYKSSISMTNAMAVYGKAWATYDSSTMSGEFDKTDATNNKYLNISGYYMFSGYTVTYDANAGTDSVTGMPTEDDTAYFKGTEITVATETPTRAGYKFLGWNTDSTAEAAATYKNGKYTIGEKDVTFYAIWKDLAYGADITVNVPELVYGLTISDLEAGITTNDSKLLLTGEIVMVYCDFDEQEGQDVTMVEKPGFYLIYTFFTTADDYYFVNRNEKTYKGKIHIENNYGELACGYEKLNGSEIVIGDVATDRVYLQILIGYAILGNNVTYDINAGDATVTGSLTEDTNTYIKGAPVALPTDVLTREKYYLAGWATTADGEAITTPTAKMGSDGLTLYAVWELKKEVAIAESTQEFTFGENGILYYAKGTELTGFEVEYFVGGEWTTKAPENSGSYDVRITRAEDEKNLAFTKVLEGGLVINKAKVAEPTVVGKYRYNREAQTVVFDGLEDYMTTNDCLTQTEEGTYIVTFTLDENHEWAEGSDGVVTWEIRSAAYQVVIPIMMFLMLSIMAVVAILYAKKAKGRGVFYILSLILNGGMAAASYIVGVVATAGIIMFLATCAIWLANFIQVEVYFIKDRKKK